MICFNVDRFTESAFAGLTWNTQVTRIVASTYPITFTPFVPTKQRCMKKKISPKFILLLLILSVAAYFGIRKLIFSLTHETTDNAQVETQIVPVLTRIPGYIKTLYVRDYDSVAKGQLLAELEDAETQAQLLEAEADLNQSRSELTNAQVSIQSARKSIEVSRGAVDLNELRLNKAITDDARDQRLLTEGALTRKAAEETRYNLDLAKQNLLNSRAELKVAESKIDLLNTTVQRANNFIALKEARIAQLKLKLSYTQIYSPLSGRIGRRQVAEGQFVQPGTPFFSVVNDTSFWVVANFKENQLHALRPGKQVSLRLDAFPDLDLTGTIANLSEATGAKFALLPPDNASGNFVKVTQRVPLKINIDQIEKVRSSLRAGMSVFVVVAND